MKTEEIALAAKVAEITLESLSEREYKSMHLCVMRNTTYANLKSNRLALAASINGVIPAGVLSSTASRAHLTIVQTIGSLLECVRAVEKRNLRTFILTFERVDSTFISPWV